MAFNLRRVITSFLLVSFIVATILALFNSTKIIDWWRLRGYVPPSSVTELAAQDTMTPSAKHLFYLNKPNITSGAVFSNNCPNGGEKTIVLGCYKGNEDGIFVYDVTDSRLNGVEQVTAAHEMLHAAYERLSNAQRKQVDGWLLDYYNHDLHDQRIIDTIAAYKKSEPNDVVNEMHSVFGTEISVLPAQLENYYTKYFSNRQAVTTYAADYQAEFTSRQKIISSYDSQLASLKVLIDTNNQNLLSRKAKIDATSNSLNSLRTAGDIGAYNAGVDSYNQLVSSYKALAQSTQNLINTYNNIVSQRNTIVLQEQQLTQAITAPTVTTP